MSQGKSVHIERTEAAWRTLELMVSAFIGSFLRGYPRLKPGEETKLLRSRAGKAGPPWRRTGVLRPPANSRFSHGS